MYKLVVSFLYDPLQCSSFVLVNTQQNVKDILYAKELVKTIEESDWQKLF